MVRNDAEKLHLSETQEISKHIENKKPNNFAQLINDWNAPILDFSKEELVGFAGSIFEAEGLMKAFEIKETTWDRFINKTYQYYSYKENPFHNFYHAVSGKFFFSPSSSRSELLG